ncbi:MAG TPA: SMP-30/gluconolactonase/LRE family protein [Plantibacter sp.]|uniref:SMP-30/gluconolactonase/LRE family protein n=1 Tax=unclassified Plantibacter TaxID=2624265 RepID=UPI002CC58AAC|nr:SMP-30/gluconolactonase/LRE family protein [Plantibacter sp.]
MTDSIVARVANDAVHVLAEGPVWDTARNRLLWVDIRRGLVLQGGLAGDGSITVTDEQRFDRTVGAIATSLDGDLLIAGSETLMVQTANGHLHEGPRIIPPGSGRRLNDGKVDPAGRFLIGSLSLTDDEPESETLTAIDQSGSMRVIDGDLTLSNGLGWSSDGRILYSVDTLRRTVYRRAYDPEHGAVGRREVFLELAAGYPDGMCLDAEDHLWIAMWGLGEVHRYSPGGDLVTVVATAALHTSSVAFAGPLLDTLVITTATQDLTPAQLLEHPDSGKLFTVVPGVLGAPVTQWGGFTAPTIPDLS